MNLANRITILRILLIPFFIATLLYYQEGSIYTGILALVIFALASFTDAIDGGIARTLDQTTELGTVLDPIADKLLIASAFISLSMMKSIPPNMKIPGGVVLIVISRDIIILLGFLVIYFLKGRVLVKPSFLGKITTFSQMIAIIAILMTSQYNKFFIYPAVFFTIISGIDYIWRGSRQLNDIQ